MNETNVFLDTNVLLYTLSGDLQKASRAEDILRAGGIISVQVLNETANVARRKLAMPWTEINELLSLIRAVCLVEPLTIQTHDLGLQISQRYQISVYDGMIAASAILAGCGLLYSEDMQDGQVIDHQLRICNPFITH